MSSPFEEDVLRRLKENIDALAPPQDATLSSRLNGVCIPQRKYDKGASRGAPNHQNLVPFLRQDGTYISVNAALREDYAGLVARDIPGLSGAGYTISLRLEWPGYPSQDSQLRTYDWRRPPQKIPLDKLATEVGKHIRQFVEKLETQDIDPEYREWRVGPNGIQLKDLRLAALEQVSAGSYQPRLFWKP